MKDSEHGKKDSSTSDILRILGVVLQIFCIFLARLDEGHAEFAALLAHVIGPDAGLDLADVGLVEEHQ